MIIYGLLLYIGIKAAFPMPYFIFCTIGICFHLFSTLQSIEKEHQIKECIIGVAKQLNDE